jgi:hypothetical protein
MSSYGLGLDTARGVELTLPHDPRPLFASPCPFLLAPEIVGARVAATEIRAEPPDRPGEGGAPVCIQGRLEGEVSGALTNELHLLPDRLVCRAWYEADRTHSLEGWRVLPEGARLAADAVQAYLGQHPQPGDGRVFPLAAPVAFSTLSHNWNYCTLAPRILLKQGPFTVALGGTTVAHDYGLEVDIAAGGAVRRLRFDYGGAVNPHPVPAGVPQAGPRLQIQVTANLGDHAANGAFTQAMIADGIVAARRYRPEDRGWFRPWYCTWGDQMLRASASLQQDVSGNDRYEAIKAVLTQDGCLATARRIRDLGLNIGTFIIDDGWQDRRGDWNLATDRFPDVRALVDALHAMNFKVVLWFAPFLLEDGAVSRRNPDRVSGPDRNGQFIMDYAKPAARAWLEEKLGLWFGRGSGGWHIDGFKVDFYMEKISPATQRGDTEWRGEEQTFRRLMALLHGHAAAHTASPGILSGPYSPHLLPYLTTLFLEERFDTQFASLYRMRPLAEAMAPGVRLTPHFNYNPATAREYLALCRALDAVPQIGVVHGTPEQYARMRTGQRADPGAEYRPVPMAELKALLEAF